MQETTFPRTFEESQPELSGRGVVGAAIGFFASFRFPVFALSALLVFELFQVAVLLLPSSEGPLGGLAEGFRSCCFGYDSAEQRVNGTLVWLLLAEPLILGALVAGLWGESLARALRRPSAMLPYVLAGALAAIATGALMARAGGAQEPREPPPAALRSAESVSSRSGAVR